MNKMTYFGIFLFSDIISFLYSESLADLQWWKRALRMLFSMQICSGFLVSVVLGFLQNSTLIPKYTSNGNFKTLSQWNFLLNT